MMFIFVIPFAVLLYWLLYEAAKPSLTTTVTAPVSKADPLEVLRIRYARGEVDKKEYDRIKKDLL